MASKEEFTDFFLSSGDITPLHRNHNACEPSFERAAEKVEKPCDGIFWWKVGQMKTMDCKEHFSLLFKQMCLGCYPSLLLMPIVKKEDSVLRKIHTNQRSNLDHSTIVRLMAFKFKL